MTRKVLWIRVFLCVLLSRSYFGISSLVFSKIQHGVRDLCEVVRDIAGFFLNFSLDKNDQKWSKIAPKQDFLTIGKILTLIYSENVFI